jgi:hypothetical protein
MLSYHIHATLWHSLISFARHTDGVLTAEAHSNNGYTAIINMTAAWDKIPYTDISR